MVGTVVVFGATTLTNPSPKAPQTDIRVKRRILWDGTQIVYVMVQVGQRWRFTCYPVTYGEVQDLLGLAGIRTTLTIDGDPKGYCNIVYFSHRAVTPLRWTYEIEFSRSTAGVS
jgi:hypothetical protein